MNEQHSALTSKERLSTPVDEHLKSVGSWIAAGVATRTAFHCAMEGKAYGPRATRDAWDWFVQGWDDSGSAPETPQPASKEEASQGPWWTPTAEVERLIRWCKGVNTITVEISIKVLEGLLHDSMLWRQDRVTKQRAAPETGAPLCRGEVRVVYEHGQPSGVRDDSGFLCHLNRLTKYEGQEERYKEELALRARQAEVIASALRSAQETCPVVPPKYRERVRDVIRQGLATYGKPRGIKSGAEADEWLRKMADQSERLPLKANACQHDLQKPHTTIEVDGENNGKCTICKTEYTL